MQDNKGYSLVEFVVSLTIFAVVISSAMLIYSRAYVNHVRAIQEVDIDENLRVALNRISRDIRQAAENVLVYKQDGSLAGDGRGTRIKFKSSTGVVIEYIYDQSDKELEVKRGVVDIPSPLASHIEWLEFHYDSNRKIVTIFIKGQRKISGLSVTRELSTKVQVRVL